RNVIQDELPLEHIPRRGHGRRAVSSEGTRYACHTYVDRPEGLPREVDDLGDRAPSCVAIDDDIVDVDRSVAAKPAAGLKGVGEPQREGRRVDLARGPASPP